jgi:MFS superfamily sulfate permease-like transporter
LTLLVIVLAFAGWAGNVPISAMSAVLFMVALRMGEWHELTRLRVMPISDAVVLIATFALTVIFDLVVAVEPGMVLAAILFIKRVSESHFEWIASAAVGHATESGVHRSDWPRKSVCPFRCSTEPGESTIGAFGSTIGPVRG